MSVPNRVVAVCGSARPPAAANALARQLGQSIVDQGWILATGGLGGVMEAASAGGQLSPKWSGSQVIGFLPGEDRGEANAYVDIAIPTGLGRARNTLLVAAADAVILVHGRAGTLSEAALAWQLGRPIGALESGGVASELSGKTLDDRRKDAIVPLTNNQEALRWLSGLFGQA